MDGWVDEWTETRWVSCQALDFSCCSKQLGLGQGPEPAARAMGQAAGSRPNKVAHDREGGGGPRDRSGGRKGVRREGGKMDGRLLELEAGAAEGDARESRWWGVWAAGDRCARPDQRFRPSPLERRCALSSFVGN